MQGNSLFVMFIFLRYLSGPYPSIQKPSKQKTGPGLAKLIPGLDRFGGDEFGGPCSHPPPIRILGGLRSYQAELQLAHYFGSTLVYTIGPSKNSLIIQTRQEEDKRQGGSYLLIYFIFL